jgi:hypothetical protein
VHRQAHDRHGVITNWTWSGDLGCEQYIDRLKRYLETRKTVQPDPKFFNETVESQADGISKDISHLR